MILLCFIIFISNYLSMDKIFSGWMSISPLRWPVELIMMRLDICNSVESFELLLTSRVPLTVAVE